MREQLRLAVDSVFDSWFAKKATEYRRIHGVPEEWGTAVTVMAMVFGNLGEASGTGVGFTRDPRTGEARFYAEFLPNAQGEDVVAGIRTPLPIEALQERMPSAYAELREIAARLERHYKDMQDIEFTVQEGTLYLLQTRGGKRSARAAVKVAVDLEKEHVIDQHTAILRVKPTEVNESIRPVFDDRERAAAVASGRLLARGLPAAPGAAVGRVVFDADRAVQWAKSGQQVILVRPETSPEDVAGMYAAEGIVTSRGGRTSHAAIVAVGMGKACVVGAADLSIDEARRQFEADGRTVREGDVLSVDGGTGEVLLDAIQTVEGHLGDELRELLSWADFYRRNGGLGRARERRQSRRRRAGPRVRRRRHRAGADRAHVLRARPAPDRPRDDHGIRPGDTPGRARAAPARPARGLHRHLPRHGRLAGDDPPPRSAAPRVPSELEGVQGDGGEKSRLETLGQDPEAQRRLGTMIEAVERLREANPMLGHRGCRLGITHPEIYGMQVRAIMEAACTAAEQGVRVEPEIMIPLTGTVGEMKETFEQTRRVADGVIAEMGVSVAYLVGTMIEVPRAALIAQKIAEHAEFFSFGTNDLTQLTFGYSRDDVAKFLPKYLDMGLVPADPFAVLDQEGVGELIALGIDRGRRRRPGLKVGICGEHGGEASSVEFCYKVGMNYVSCSPYLVPGARLAAAQARIKERLAGGTDHR